MARAEQYQLLEEDAGEQLTTSAADLDYDTDATILAEGQIYDFITNQPLKDTPTERIVQVVARALVEEYGFDHTQLARDQTFIYSEYDEDGKLRKLRQRLTIAVYPEGARKDDFEQVIRICLVQDPKVKANDPKKGVLLLEELLGALPRCDYGLWTNGTDQVYKQKLTGGRRIQPEYVDLYDLPGNGEDATDLDR